MEIEITVLSVPKKSSFDDISPHIHGVVLSQNGLKSTFLPQVWEQLPEKELFLSALCQKGGMDGACWKDPETKIETYTGLVFSEAEL